MTQPEVTECVDQTTTTHRAAESASPITWSNGLPNGMSRSHQTDQPCVAASALANGCTRPRSPLA